MDVALNIEYLVPAAKYRGVTNENTEKEYNDLVWEDSRKKPSWDEIVSVNNDVELSSYKHNRIKAYPSIGDQLDVIWKELNYRRLNGENLVQDTDDMLGRILSIKSQFPKPKNKGEL